jgi:hypothetical protein
VNRDADSYLSIQFYLKCWCPLCEVWGSHKSVSEDADILEYDVLFGEYFPPFLGHCVSSKTSETICPTSQWHIAKSVKSLPMHRLLIVSFSFVQTWNHRIDDTGWSVTGIAPPEIGDTKNRRRPDHGSGRPIAAEAEIFVGQSGTGTGVFRQAVRFSPSSQLSQSSQFSPSS